MQFERVRFHRNWIACTLVFCISPIAFADSYLIEQTETKSASRLTRKMWLDFPRMRRDIYGADGKLASFDIIDGKTLHKCSAVSKICIAIDNGWTVFGEAIVAAAGTDFRLSPKQFGGKEIEWQTFAGKKCRMLRNEASDLIIAICFWDYYSADQKKHCGTLVNKDLGLDICNLGIDIYRESHLKTGKAAQQKAVLTPTKITEMKMPAEIFKIPAGYKVR